MTKAEYGRMQAVAQTFEWGELDELSDGLDALDNMGVPGAGSVEEFIGNVMFYYDELRGGIPF